MPFAINGFLRVQTLCALANRSSDDVEEGCLAFVAATGQYFRMSTETPAIAPDGSTVLTTWGGPAMAPCAQSYTGTGTGRWILTNLSDIVNPFASVAAWFIDPVHGLDTNSGLTAISPLQTFRALAARWAGITVPTAITVTIYVLSQTVATGGLAAGDFVYLKRPTTPTNPIVIDASHARLILASSSVTAYTPVTRATNTSSQVTGLLTVGTWTTYLHKVVRLTSGANAGAWAVILENLGANVAKTTPFVKQATSTTVALTQVSPAPGDPFEIVDFISLNDGVAGNFPYVDIGLGNLWMSDVSLNDAGGAAQTQADGILSAGNVYAYRSRLSIASRGLAAVDLSSLVFGGCDIVGSAPILHTQTGVLDFEACAYANIGGLLTIAGSVIVDGDTTLFPGTSFVGITASSLIFGNVNIDKAASPAIDFAYNAGLAKASNAAFNAAIYGATIPTTHVSLHDFCLATYGAATHWYAVVTGGQHRFDFQNGILKDAVDLPFGSTATFSDSQAYLLLQK